MIQKNSNRLLFSAMIFSLLLVIPGTVPAFAQPTAVDIVFVVDESGSMTSEQAFIITDLVDDLEAALIAQGLGTGVDKNKYGAVGFACVSGDAQFNPRVNPGELRVETDLVDAATFTGSVNFCTDGFLQDGYAAIDYATSAITWRGANFAKQIILVTDEDRDDLIPITSSAVDKANTKANVQSVPSGLNAIICHGFKDGLNNPALGVVPGNGGTAYLQAPLGTFTTTSGGVPTTNLNCAGSLASSVGVLVDYIDLADSLSGGAWNISVIDGGGDAAQSFAKAFAHAKVTEIVPVGGSILPIDTTALLLSGAFTNAFWMAPVLVGATVTAAFYLKTRKH